MRSLFLFFSFLLPFSLPSSGEKKHSSGLPLNKALIKQIKKQGANLVSDRLGSYILRAESLAEGKKHDQAIELLNYHYQRESFTKAEKALLALHIGTLYRQSKKEEKSLQYLQQALDLKALPYSQHLSALYNISQIYAEKENYDKALELLKLWFSVNENPFPQSYILLAYCYYAKDQIQKALKYVEKTISLIDKPKENWLQFATAIYLKQKNFEKAQSSLERLTALYPSNPSHWKQLAGVYLYRDKNHYAFITLDMADKMGHLKSKGEYLNLSALYVEQGLPYQGALLLKQKIKEGLIPKERKNFEFLAEAFWLAREENSSLAYLKKAAQTAKTALFFLKYGQRLLASEIWTEAEQAFRKALNTKEIQKSIQDIQKYKKSLAMAKRRQMERLFPNIYSQRAETKSLQTDQANRKSDPVQSGVEPKSLQTDQAMPLMPIRNEAENSPSLREDSSGELKPSQYKKDKGEKPEDQKITAPPTNRLEKIYFGIGIALYHQKKYEQALSYFKKSIEVDDTFVSGYQWIGWTEKSMEQDNSIEQEKQENGSKLSPKATNT